MSCHQDVMAPAETVTIKRIAEVLKISRQAAVKRAKAGGWSFEVKTVRGGRQHHYRVDCLPDDVREALNHKAAIEAVNANLREWERSDDAKLLKQAAADRREEERRKEERREARRASKESGMARFAALSPEDPKRKRAKARKLVIETLHHFRRQRGIPLAAAFEQFAAAANAGETSLPEDVWEYMPHYKGRCTLTAATLKRWHYALLNKGVHALVDGYGHRKGHFKVCDIEGLADIVIGLMLQAPHITPEKVRAYVAATRPDIDQPTESSYRRFMNDWKQNNAQSYTYHTNPDAWKNQYMAAVGSHQERIERLNQVWELDSTPGDWMLKDGRHSVIGVIDLYSRRLKLYVSKTSTAVAVCQVFRRATLDWGICEIARTDNGKDYVSRQFTSVLQELEVEQELCVPFASEQKGTIERAFRTMSHGILDLLPGFIGHNVAQRKEIEERKSFAQRVMTSGETVEVEMTSEELQELLDQWCQVYHHTEHDGMDSKTPFEMATAWTAPVRRIQDERALDLLLAEIGGTRVIGKKGIRFEGHSFDAPELFEHVGREAVLKRDEADIGRLYVYVEGEFIAVAECAELLGISRKERAAASTAAQKRFLAEKNREHRELKKAVNKNIGRVVLEHQLEQIQNIETLHRPSVDYTPEGLRQAGRAASRELPPVPETTQQQEDDRARLAAEMAAEAQAPVVESETPERRYQRWMRLDRRVQAGERLEEKERRWHESYQRSNEWRAERTFFEDFGAQGERQ